MHQHNIVRIMSLVALMVTGAVAMAQSIAVLKGPEGHGKEFDSAFDTLGWKATYYANTKESVADFAAHADKYDVALSTPLFNPAAGGNPAVKDTTIGPAIRAWLEKGGVLVMTDGCYAEVRQWLTTIDPTLGGVQNGKCTSSQWAVLGHVRNAEPIDPIRCFPNMITEGDHWGHFETLPAGSPWRPVAFCSEGKPVVLVRPIGKGLVVLSALRQPHAKTLENYYANSQLLKSGLAVSKFSLSDPAIGPGRLNLELLRDAPAGSAITYEITSEKGQTQTFSTNFVGKACMMDFIVSLRGPVSATLSLDTPAGRKTLFRRVATLPELLTVAPNVYRGILSTERRTDKVSFKVSIAPGKENVTNSTLNLSVYDSSSNMVATMDMPGPTNNLPVEMWVPFPLPRTLSAGAYSLRALLKKGYSYKRAETSFDILAPRPAQTIIDEDNTLLVNGKPFFPLGIYHISPDEYKLVSDIGFNTVQFWKWHTGENEYGVPYGLYKAMANNLRCVFENNHNNDAIRKYCVDHYGIHPATLMWYVWDEPAEGCEARMQETNDAWHRFDKQHPTYLLSCRPDLFKSHCTFGDVFAFDPYGDPKKPFTALKKAIEWLRTAEKVTEGRQPLVVVPWATPSDPAEIRPLAYASLAHNARGIIWYCWNQAGGGPLGIGLHNNPACQKKCREVIEEINTMSVGLCSPQRRPFEEGPIHGIACGIWPGIRFVVLVNVSGAQVNADFVVPEMVTMKIKQATLPFAPKVQKHDAQGKVVLDKKGAPVLEEQPVTINNGRIQYSFKPYETRVYRW